MFVAGGLTAACFFSDNKMKRLIITSIVILITFFIVDKGYAQKGQSKPEIAKWQSEKDNNTYWEFKTDGKMYASYTGTDVIQIFTYSISSDKPICQEGVILSEEENIKYLTLKFDKYNTISCYYIYALNDSRFTVMDAESGHIFPMIKAE